MRVNERRRTSSTTWTIWTRMGAAATPLDVDAVICVMPLSSVVRRPLMSMVARFSFCTRHATEYCRVTLVALFTVAVRLACSPRSMLKLGWLMTTSAGTMHVPVATQSTTGACLAQADASVHEASTAANSWWRAEANRSIDAGTVTDRKKGNAGGNTRRERGMTREKSETDPGDVPGVRQRAAAPRHMRLPRSALHVPFLTEGNLSFRCIHASTRCWFARHVSSHDCCTIASFPVAYSPFHCHAGQLTFLVRVP